MHGSRHLLIGAGVGCFVAGLAPTRELGMVTIGVSAVSALLPDLDHKHSMATYYGGIPIVLGLVAGVLLLTVVLTALIGSVVIGLGAALLIGAGAKVLLGFVAPYRVFRHRGPMHSVLFGVLVGAVVLGLLTLGGLDGPRPAWLSSEVATLVSLAVTLGWWSHLAADDLTYRGQPLGWPFFRAPVHRHKFHGRITTCRLFHVTPSFLRFASGSAIEWPIAFGALVVGAWHLLA